MRTYFDNKPSIDMRGELTDWGSTLEVALWDAGKGFCLHLTYEERYELDREYRKSLVPALSQFEEDQFLNEYHGLFLPLQHYIRSKPEQMDR